MSLIVICGMKGGEFFLSGCIPKVDFDWSAIILIITLAVTVTVVVVEVLI